MTEYSMVQAPILSFYSKPFYRNVLKNGKGTGFLYLFLLLVCLWTLQTVRTYIQVETGLSDPDLKEFKDQLPDFDMKGGKLSINKPSPWKFIDKDGRTICVIDTSGQLKTLEQAQTRLLITEEYAVAEKSNGVEQKIPFKGFEQDFSVKRADIDKALSQLPMWIAAIMWLCGIFVWLGHIIQAAIYGCVGLFFDKTKLGYGACVRLASFAMTPAMIVSCLMALSGFTFSGFGALCLVATIVYIILGFKTLKDEEKSTSNA